VRKSKSLRKKADLAVRLVFYREDIEALQALLRRLAQSQQLDACLVYSARHEALVAGHGTVAPHRREELIRAKRKGLSLGWDLRLIGLAADATRTLEPATADDLRAFLKQIAVRNETGERITMEFGRPFGPRRA
jgi:hypothetical protein